MKKSLSVLSLFMLVFSSMMPIGVGDAYYLNGDESVNYPQGNDITFYDVAGNEREVMSYNLGATSTDIEDEDSYGLFFQRGNNYGFTRENSNICYSQSEFLSTEGLEITSVTENFCDYNGTTSNRTLGAQGPCPDGYHVPSINEWNNLFVQRCEDDELCDTTYLSNTSSWGYEDHDDYRYVWFPDSNPSIWEDIVERFMDAYNLQLAGRRYPDSVSYVGEFGRYWSSTFTNDNGYNYAWRFYISLLNGVGVYTTSPDRGQSVRCFKDSSEDVPVTLALDLYVGESSLIDRVFVPANQVLPDSKKEKLNQYDWYMCNSMDEVDDIVASISSIDDFAGCTQIDLDTVQFTESDKDWDSNTIRLYGSSKCNAGQSWDGEKCICEKGQMDEDIGECVYEIEDIQGNVITIMSYNLGATAINPMGDFYQWGSNYKYSRYPVSAVNNGDCNLDNNGNGYCPLDGYDDSNVETDYYKMDRFYMEEDQYVWTEGDQGPCPDGYHVPSIKERSNVLVHWCEEDDVCDVKYDLNYGKGDDNSNIEHWYLGYSLDQYPESGDPILSNMVNSFMEEYNLPLAGVRNADSIYYVGTWGGYRSSLNGNSRAFNFGIKPSNGIGIHSSSPRGGLPIRCFSDATKDMGMPIALDLYAGGCTTFKGHSVAECYHNFLGRKFVQPGQVVNATILNEAANLNNPREGYQWVWYRDDNQSEKFDVNTPVSDDFQISELYVFEEEIPMYTVTFNSNGGSTVNSMDIEEGKPIQTLPTSKKDGYTLEGWYLDEGLTARYTKQPITGATTLYARWTENKGNGYSGGGGGSSSKPNTEQVDKQHNAADEETKKAEPEIKKEEGKNIKIITNAPINTEKETFNAHQWAYSKGLTKYRTSSEARMDDFLNRSEMAKISSIFATEFLDKTPDTKKKEFCSQYSDMWKVEDDMKFFIAESCELGYMGYESNGVDALERFRPYTPLTVAETATILSRIVWGNENAMNGKDWYKGHLYAAYNYGLIDDIKNPTTRSITRKEAYTMLYRLINMIE